MSENGRFSLRGISDLMSKGRSGRYGDLRLLGLSLGIILLCAVSLLILQAINSHEQASAPKTDAALAASPAQESTVAADETGSAAAQFSSFDGQMEPQGVVASPRSEEEQRRILREMAANLPEGETITF